MTNRLEDFIQNNLDEFDAQPMKTGWDKVEAKLSPKKTKVVPVTSIWWAAAAVAGILLVGSVVYLSTKSETPGIAINKTQNSSQETVSNDEVYSKQMYQFVNLIEQKQTELKQIGEQHPRLYQQFIKDINSLDSSFAKLKSALPANPNKEVLVEAMIKNLQIQIELLNRQLQIIKQLKQKSSGYESKTI